jgi:hypothetical protein
VRLLGSRLFHYKMKEPIIRSKIKHFSCKNSPIDLEMVTIRVVLELSAVASHKALFELNSGSKSANLPSLRHIHDSPFYARKLEPHVALGCKATSKQLPFKLGRTKPCTFSKFRGFRF